MHLNAEFQQNFKHDYKYCIASTNCFLWVVN